METLMKEISKILDAKNLDIYLLESENKRLKAENAELKAKIDENEKEIKGLCRDIASYIEAEEKKV